MLPFLYVCSYLFERELRAILSLLLYQVVVQWMLPYVTMYVRLNSDMITIGDYINYYSKVLPMQNAAASMLFNPELLKAMASYREYKDSDADSIETDEETFLTIKADIFWMLA